MTRVLAQAKRCGTAGSPPAQCISATCPMSHFFFVEIEQRVKGAPEPPGNYPERRGTCGTWVIESACMQHSAEEQRGSDQGRGRQEKQQT